MKKFIGILAILLSIAFLSILVLRIWDIEIISLSNLIRSSATLLILGIATIILIVCYGVFFRKPDVKYQSKVGNRAHPKM